MAVAPPDLAAQDDRWNNQEWLDSWRLNPRDAALKIDQAFGGECDQMQSIAELVRHNGKVASVQEPAPTPKPKRKKQAATMFEE